MQNKKATKLPLKIYSFNMQKSSLIYFNGEIIDFYIDRKIEKHQTVYGWLNKTDFLLMLESSKDINGNILYNKLYLVDIYKNIVDTIYIADNSKGEVISGAYISPNDSILLIHLHHKPEKKDTEGWFYSPLDILVMDFNSKRIIERLENFCLYNIHFRQSTSNIFSSDSKQFVYAISDDRNWYGDDREEYELIYKEDNGIYIYDLVNKRHQKIIDEGINPIWAPDGGIIAFINNNEIWFYNIEEKEKVMFYKTKNNQDLVKIYWAPGGERIYVMTRNKSKLNQRAILTHRIIDVKDRTEMVNGELTKLGLSFFWK